jgi:hypothetical protein
MRSNFTRQFFRGELDFLTVSQRIAKHLYARSQHPNISAGDLFVILFSGLSDGDRELRAWAYSSRRMTSCR